MNVFLASFIKVVLLSLYQGQKGEPGDITDVS